MPNVLEHLQKPERKWRDRQPLLEARGYQLRPRFRPGWVPSWKGTDRNPHLCEDGQRHLFEHYIDATRIEDNHVVILKAVKPGTSEITIATLLSTEESRADPHNHCVPILEHISAASVKESEVDFLVVPLLRKFDDPPFFLVQEALDFIQQTIEGLEYMHRRGVAHRDCGSRNIMMDASPLFDEPTHPMFTGFDMSLTRRVSPFRRCYATAPIKYYFIDFGMSSYFPDSRQSRLVTGTLGQETSVPELSGTDPYDPFKVDVFTLGSLYQHQFIKVYRDLDPLRPLFHGMTHKMPNGRPTAMQALEQFMKIRSRFSGMSSRWRLRPRKESRMLCFILDLRCAGWELIHLLRTTPFTLFRLFTFSFGQQHSGKLALIFRIFMYHTHTHVEP